MKVLVTGSSGFIGKQVFDYLLEKKYDVYGVSRKPTNKKNIFKFSLNEKNKIIECFEKIQFDAIIHLASLVPSNHQIDPTKIFQNCKNTLNLLDCCRKFKVKKFVFAGAHLVYGKTQYLPIDENHSTIPTSNYGSVKLIEENLCRMFYNTYKQNCIILRISSVYGPTQPGRHIIPTMMKNVIENKSIFVNEFSNGLQLMDLIHVNDVCQALELACKTKEEFFVGNIASGKGITAKEIARIISNISGNKKIHVQKIDEVTNHFIYDIENSAKILKFRPKEKIDEKSLAKWYKILEKEFKCK